VKAVDVASHFPCCTLQDQSLQLGDGNIS